MSKANTVRKASTQKVSRFSIRASATQKKVIAEAARIKDTTISDFVLAQEKIRRHGKPGPQLARATAGVWIRTSIPATQTIMPSAQATSSQPGDPTKRDDSAEV